MAVAVAVAEEAGKLVPRCCESRCQEKSGNLAGWCPDALCLVLKKEQKKWQANVYV